MNGGQNTAHRFMAEAKAARQRRHQQRLLAANKN